ncbi:MAG: arsenosugar biosynthesis radical SAM (seleno)protein ArsS [Planctomycetota bacterium]
MTKTRSRAEQTRDRKRRITLDLLRGGAFAKTAGAIRPAPMLRTLQINIGLVCNLACRHCHVESSPKRKEAMTWETLEHVLRIAREANDGVGVETIDITGGAPEMHEDFRRFVDAATGAGHRVMVRTNLTIMNVDGYTDLPQWYGQRKLHLVASLPCYLENNVDKQRGRGVYHDSIEVIRKLNDVGYGVDEARPLDLVFNPGGPSLPPRQEALEPDYKRELDSRYGLKFSRLICITNMPLGRFLNDLAREGRDDEYMTKLKDAYNPGTIEGLMCRHHMHVGWDGTLHDCDFNYALNLPAAGRMNIADVDLSAWHQRRVVLGDHCFGCTAGAGSSCGGEVALPKG